MDEAAYVSIVGTDSNGWLGKSDVEIDIPPGVTWTITSKVLESRDFTECGFSGYFGNGTGKWRLRISSNRPLNVMNLLINRSGDLVNLSTTPYVVPFTTPGERKECTNQRELALRYGAVAVRE